MGFFDLFDFVTAKYMMPLGGLLITLFIGWYLKQEVVREELTNTGTLQVRTYKFLFFLIRWVAPVGVILIFLNELMR